MWFFSENLQESRNAWFLKANNGNGIWEGWIMIRFDCECECGRSFSMFVDLGALIECPYCGKQHEVLLRNDDASGNHESKSLEEAASEVLSEGGLRHSGAR